MTAALCMALGACEVAGGPLVEIKINEVESDGLADFIELVNTSATPIDVTGFVLKDNDDSRTLTIPNMVNGNELVRPTLEQSREGKSPWPRSTKNYWKSA